MGQLSSRRQRKLKSRQQKDKQAARDRKARDKYPQITFANENAPKIYRDTLKEALRTFSFGDKTLFSKDLRRLFRIQHDQSLRYAFKNVLHVSHDEWEDAGEAFAPSITGNYFAWLTQAIGAAILRRAPSLVSYSPATAFFVQPEGPHGRDWAIQFSSLRNYSTDKGKLYYSTKEHEAVVRNVRKRVAFTSHVLRRICERVFKGYKTYRGMADAHAFFQCLSYFKSVVLRHKDGRISLALAIYYPCTKISSMWPLLVETLGDDLNTASNHYWLLGYLPLVFTDDFWVAKTLLLPGYRGTPEHIAVLDSSLPHRDGESLLDALSLSTPPVRALQWFQTHGVPQILETQKMLFDVAPLCPASPYDYPLKDGTAA